MNPTLSYQHQFSPGQSGSGDTLLLLHGTGGNERDLLPLGRFLDLDAALLSPRGDVSEQGRARFFRRLAEGVFDIDDLKRRTETLADFLRNAEAAYSIDLKRTLAVGYSNGANMAASLLLLRPESLQGAILFRPMLPLEPDELPALAGKPVLMLSGQADPFARPDQAAALRDVLERAGADVTWEALGGGHQLSQADFDRARGWLTALRAGRRNHQ